MTAAEAWKDQLLDEEPAVQKLVRWFVASHVPADESTDLDFDTVDPCDALDAKFGDDDAVDEDTIDRAAEFIGDVGVAWLALEPGEQDDEAPDTDPDPVVDLSED